MITVEELRRHIGEYVWTARYKTPLERRAYASDPSLTEGGGGILVGVHESCVRWTFEDDEEYFGVVPCVEVDWGFTWPILPGTYVTFGEDNDARYLLECIGSSSCEAVKHVHGCFADNGSCDDPGEGH